MTRKLLLDTDPGCDDAAAIAFALGCDAVDTVGVTTVAGNSTVENTTENAIAVLEALDRPDVPVAKGCDRPLVKELTLAEHVHGDGGLYGELTQSGTAVDAHAVDFIIDQARRHGDDLTIAAVGPLTNVAVAIAREPALPNLVDDIYVMGGAAFEAGNATPVAEFNIYNDPEAASRVTQAAEPKIVGLDATNDATLPYDTVRELHDRNPRLEHVAKWCEYAPEIPATAERRDRPSLHDPAVVAAVVDDVVAFERHYTQIDTSGGLCEGQVVCDEPEVTGNPPNADIAVDIDASGFRDRLLDAYSNL